MYNFTFNLIHGKLNILLSIKIWHGKGYVELYSDLDFNHNVGEKVLANYGKINFVLSNISFFSVIFFDI